MSKHSGYHIPTPKKMGAESCEIAQTGLKHLLPPHPAQLTLKKGLTHSYLFASMLYIPNTVLLFAPLFFKETESFCVTQPGLGNLDSSDLMPQSPKRWPCKHIPPNLATLIIFDVCL